MTLIPFFIRIESKMANAKTYRLSELAEIVIGYQHRERVLDAEHGSHQMIQARDVVFETVPEIGFSGWRVKTENLDRVTPKGDATRYRLSPGDVLFVSRGVANIAIPMVHPYVEPFPEDWDTIIPAYLYYILHPKTDIVTGEYLAWFINQPPTQAAVSKQLRGSLLKLLPKAEFEALAISVPPLEMQERIVQLERLRAQEESLLKRLIATRQHLIQQTCLRAISE